MQPQPKSDLIIISENQQVLAEKIDELISLIKNNGIIAGDLAPIEPTEEELAVIQARSVFETSQKQLEEAEQKLMLSKPSESKDAVSTKKTAGRKN